MSRSIISLIAFVGLTALTSYACDDGNITRVGPTTLASRAPFVNGAITVQPLGSNGAIAVRPLIDITPSVVRGGLCPLVPPLVASVDLVMTADRTTDLRLHQVQLRFVDLGGTTAAFKSMDHLDLVGLFGSTLVPSLATRTFPLALPFGCIGGQTGTLSVAATTIGLAGRESRTSFDLRVR